MHCIVFITILILLSPHFILAAVWSFWLFKVDCNCCGRLVPTGASSYLVRPEPQSQWQKMLLWCSGSCTRPHRILCWALLWMATIVAESAQIKLLLLIHPPSVFKILSSNKHLYCIYFNKALLVFVVWTYRDTPNLFHSPPEVEGMNAKVS